jgi:urease accessory protein
MSGFAAGILHPLTGMDHFAAMLLVGLWAGLIAGRAAWLLPTAFLCAMLGGFVWGALGSGVRAEMGAEILIILSVLALGGAVAAGLRIPVGFAVAAAGLFGFAHGFAHGVEAPAEAGTLGFAGGFLMVTAALHALGLAVARRVPPRWTRGIGAVGAGFGLFLAGTA